MENKNIKELWKEYDKNRSNIYIRNMLFEHYYPCLKNIAKVMKTKIHYLQYEEFLSSGSIGLIRAIELFNIKKNVPFEAFASIKIRGAIIDSIREEDTMTRPYREKQKKNLLDEKDKIEILSYNLNYHYDNGKEYQIIIEDKNKSHTKEYDNYDEILFMLKSLKSIDKEIITYYYINNFTMKKIGELLNLSEARVSQKHKEILELLKKRFNKHE
jgi:RNA polymerase sigma factor for flagellar operon FliA